MTSIAVDNVQGIAASCTPEWPSRNPRSVAGDVGSDFVAPPVTTTASTDETTPGFQTEAGMAQSPGQYYGHPVEAKHLARSPYAPAEPGQAGESANAANTNAIAAARAEIVPGNTLGVSISNAESALAPGAVPATGAKGAEAGTGSAGERSHTP